MLAKDRERSARLPGELQEGFPEEATFELSPTRLGVFPSSQVGSPFPAGGTTFTGCESMQLVLGLGETFSVARTWPVSLGRSRSSRGNIEPGMEGLGLLC